MNTRQAVFSGKFYPEDKLEINHLLKKIIQIERPKIKSPKNIESIIGAVLPHAGYAYSAYQAIHYFELLQQKNIQPETIIIINPNHTAYGEKIALDNNKYWETPYGKIELDHEFMDLLPFSISPEAHRDEHSGEVLLPYFQYYLKNKFKIIPITLSEQTPENAQKIAHEIYQANQKLNRKIQFIASSDFSHFETVDFGIEQDQHLIDEILKFNTQMVYNKVKKHSISVCGYGPIMSLMYYSQLVNKNAKVKILRRGHSGEVHYSKEVVDYISILFYT
ncbi:MAG: AmmeMemoRadiSam system protein B [Bacteroidales bacterium]|nr:AmmeMemoRadiSam system protein B [Bacteroidales bacterium]